MLISSIEPQLPTHPNFAVVDVLAASDFGWEYLIEDADGLLVLEEFLPSAATSPDLAALAAELQQRINVAAPIQHPQLAPSGAAWQFDDRLFWVREYIPGTRFQQYLTHLVTQGESCTEDAVRQFLIAVLQPLAALHDHGLSHGAIDQNGILWRADNDALILQRFGVRAFGLAHDFYRLQPWLTSDWPAEQTAIAKDLHDLAGLALLLLIGCERLDSVTRVLAELSQTSVISHDFVRILTPMLIPKPWQSFSDAGAVLQALLAAIPHPQDAQLQDATPSIALPITPAPIRRSVHQSPPSPALNPIKPTSSAAQFNRQDPFIMALSVGFISLVSLSLWRIATVVKIPGLRPPIQPAPISRKVPAPVANATDQMPTNLDSNAPEPAPTQENTFAKPSGIPADLYDQLVSEIPPSKQPPEQQLNSILQTLSTAARQDMGSYYRRNYNEWFATLAARKISQTTVDILADTAFYQQFPTLQQSSLNPRTFGQIWYAIARDQITALNQQQNLKSLNAGSYNETGKLYNGGGRVLQVSVRPGQGLKLFLKTRKQDVRLSIVKHEMVLARDSTDTQWTAPPAAQGGTYEIILTPARSDTVAYKLSLKAL